MPANVNPETGIRYGVVALSSLAEWVFDEFFYNGTDITLKSAENDYRSENGLDTDDEIPQEWYDEYHAEESEYELSTDGMELLLLWLGGAPLVMVLSSPLTSECRECSPCVPNAGDLDSKDPGGFETYDLPQEWYAKD